MYAAFIGQRKRPGKNLLNRHIGEERNFSIYPKLGFYGCENAMLESIKVIKRILDYVCFNLDIVFIPKALFTAFKYFNIRKATKFDIEL